MNKEEKAQQMLGNNVADTRGTLSTPSSDRQSSVQASKPIWANMQVVVHFRSDKIQSQAVRASHR